MRKTRKSNNMKQGFTLVEVSIVIVIIGLIAGSILVGRDLIRSASIRAQISQIEQLNTAVNTFKNKYDYLPGDIPATDAANLGLADRGPYGNNQGNGLIDPVPYSGMFGSIGGPTGEANRFWLDLSDVGLIRGKFLAGDPNTYATGNDVANYLPRSQLGGDRYVYVWSKDTFDEYTYNYISKSINYFTVAGVTNYCGYNTCGFWNSNANISVADAYNIDNKIDDGMPQSGKVIAAHLIFANGWGGGTAMWASFYQGSLYGSPTDARAGSASTCMDNNNTPGQPQKYSLQYNNGSSLTCALTFQFQ